MISVSTGKITSSGSVLVWDIPLLNNSPDQNQAILVISVSIQSGLRAASGTAYHAGTIDVLDPSLTYSGFVGSPPGNVFNFVPSGSPGGTLTWNKFNMVAGYP